MKLAWLCYDDDAEFPAVTILFEEPDRYARYSRVVCIVYAEITQ